MQRSEPRKVRIVDPTKPTRSESLDELRICVASTQILPKGKLRV